MQLRREETARQLENVPTVLVVDDNAAVREMIASFFSHSGFEVLLANDGREGVNTFQKHRDVVRVIVTDYAMPRLNGVDFIRAISDCLLGVPTILMSGDISSLCEEELNMFARCMTKPFDPSMLVANVRAVLDLR